MRIRDHQLHATQAAAKHALEESRPECLGFRRADVQSDDLPLTLGVRSHGDYRRDGDDPAALALLEVGRVKPEIRPFAGQWTTEERMNPFVDLLAQLGDLRLADPAQAHGLNQLVDPSRRNATDPSFLDHRELNDGPPSAS